jgi:CHAT domain-containing protein
VHWATHSLLDDIEPGFSGLVVSPSADGRIGPDANDLVSIHELEALTLDADLVVCSACQTGLGVIRAGEGTIGMARSLLAAGARCVVMSLWPVPDLPTRRLMTAFYRTLLTGAPAALALHLAEREVRRAYARVDGSPYPWAGFVLIGDGDRSLMTSPEEKAQRGSIVKETPGTPAVQDGQAS